MSEIPPPPKDNAPPPTDINQKRLLEWLRSLAGLDQDNGRVFIFVKRDVLSEENRKSSPGIVRFCTDSLSPRLGSNPLSRIQDYLGKKHSPKGDLYINLDDLFKEYPPLILVCIDDTLDTDPTTIKVYKPEHMFWFCIGQAGPIAFTVAQICPVPEDKQYDPPAMIFGVNPACVTDDLTTWATQFGLIASLLKKLCAQVPEPTL